MKTKKLAAWLLASVMTLGSFQGYGPIVVDAAETTVPAAETTETDRAEDADESAVYVVNPKSTDVQNEAGLQYLTSEPWYKSNLVTVGTGWGELGVNTGVINPNTGLPDGGDYIMTGGKRYDYGFAAHAASQIVFDIENMGVTNFSAIAGIHNDRGGASCGFIVMADKEILWEKDCLKGGETAEVNVAIPEGTKQLILITNDGGDGNSYDHSVWAMPAVTVDPAAEGTLRRISLETPGFLTADDPAATAKVTGVLTDGKTADLENAEIVFSTDNKEVLDVDAATGALTLKGRGTANITVSVTLDGITRTATNMITVDNGSGERAWEVKSPDGNVVVTLTLVEGNELHYSAKKEGKVIVNDSTLGINTDLADFTGGLLWKTSSLEEVDTTYTMISGKASEIENHYNELSLTFGKGDAEMTLYMRAQEDGYAYRYAVNKTDGSSGDLSVYGENGTYALPEGTELFMMDNADRFDHKFNHEGAFERVMLEDVYEHLTAHEESHDNIQEIYVSMPFLAESEDGLWTLITEANLYDDAYVGSYVEPVSEDDTALKVTIPDQQEYWTGHAEVQTTYPFETPWRLAITGDLGDVVESTMVTDVSDDPYLDMDFSWVDPGVTSWTWLSEGLSGQKEEEVVRKYVDLAYEMGWSYYIMDEGWQPVSQVAGKRYDGYYDWFDDMVEYAADRDVELIAWILAHDLDTPEEREVLKEYAEKGIAGIKVDFFDIDDQDTIQLYKDIYEECAKYGLIVNAHGANKPTGESRTYPNVINREAVSGQEFGAVNAYQSTFWPFIRNVVGSMDITPRITPSGGTSSRMAALFVMFESGMPCVASSAEEVKASNVVSLLKGLPASWDEIHYIDGYPSEYATLARRSGDLWYAASINSNDKARDAVFPLDFLEEDTDYCAVIYKDGATDSDVVVEYQIVTNEDTLTIPMKKIGGCTLKLIPLVEGSTVNQIQLPDEIVLEVGESLEIDYAILPEEFEDTGIIWTVEDSSVASMSKNKVTAVNVGTTVITAMSEINPTITATCVVRVPGENYTLTEDWTIQNMSTTASDQPALDTSNPNKITLKTVSGDVDYNGSAKNLILRDAPEGDFELTVKLQGKMENNYQKAGLVIWHDATNSVSTVRRYHGGLNNGTSSRNHFGMFSYLNQYLEPVVLDEDPEAEAWLKIVKEGNTFTGYYSYDHETWTKTGTITNDVVGTSDQLKIGVYACGGTGATITFEDFTCSTINDGKVLPFAGVKTTKNVVQVGRLKDVTVYENVGFADLGLAEKVALYLDNGEKVMAPVKWNAEGYEAAEGTYTIKGTADISGIEGVKSDKELTVTVKVTVMKGEKPVEKLEIVKQPVNTSALKGENAAVTVEVKGEGLTYKWYYKNSGNKKFYESGDQFLTDGGASYTIPMYAWRDGQQVYCVITDAQGNSVQTDTVTLTMKIETGSIVIVKQPKDVSVDSVGKKAVVTVEATGEGLTYKWYYKNPGNVKFYESNAEFANSNEYAIEVSKWRDGQQVYCVITDAQGNSVQTDIAVLSVK